jgi:hypothetical protein
VPPFRAAQIIGARFAFFVSPAHVNDRLKQGDGVFESGLGNPLLRVCVGVSHVDDCCQDIELGSGGLESRLGLRMGAQNACIALPVRYIE